MKNFILHIVKAFGIYAVLGVASLSAQVGHKIAVNVPFDFAVLDKHLSAGTYTFASDTPQSPIFIWGGQGGTGIFVLAFSAQASKIQDDTKLVFHRYGDQYFLSRIWYLGTDQGRELRVSKVEQEVARNMPKPEETTLLVAGSKRHKALQ
jgi:hypothetical protein